MASLPAAVSGAGSEPGDAVTLQRHFHDHDGIQQIWLPGLGVVDRCTTCHVGLKEASLADVSAQPFRRASGNPSHN
jgi:hypothetical protein